VTTYVAGEQACIVSSRAVLALIKSGLPYHVIPIWAATNSTCRNRPALLYYNLVKQCTMSKQEVLNECQDLVVLEEHV
jgi:hypothetical protein